MSGSGVATTVTLGGFAWPLLKKAGYPKEQGGGVLAAAGIGAILSPPTLGAAAFIIAELLNVSYLQVLVWATIPTLLYYLGIILAIEMDARRLPHARGRTSRSQSGGRAAAAVRVPLQLAGRDRRVHGDGHDAVPGRRLRDRAGLRAELPGPLHWITPQRVGTRSASGATGALSVIPVMAVAGIIVGVMTLTGLA